MKDTVLANFFGMTSATVGNYRKAADKRRKLYDAMLEYYKRIDDDVYAIDKEYFISEDDRYITYKTIRDNQPLFAMFKKQDMTVSSLSAELEDDIDSIREILAAYADLSG
jgi:hypothetical protein